jgi:hypothetical protein
MLLLEPEQRRPELANLLALHAPSPAPCLPPGRSKYRGEPVAAQGLEESCERLTEA